MPGRNQGEGDRASARKYNEKTRSFAKSGRVEPKAQAAKEALEGDEAASLKEAEKAGKAQSKEREIGKSRRRERVSQYGKNSVGAIKSNTNKIYHTTP